MWIETIAITKLSLLVFTYPFFFEEKKRNNLESVEQGKTNEYVILNYDKNKNPNAHQESIH